MYCPCNDSGRAKVQHTGIVGDNMERVTVDKFGLGVRATHWLHAVLVIAFLVTGYGIYSGTYLFGDYAVNLALHMSMAFVILLDGIAHIYFLSVTGERRALLLGMKDIKDIIMIAKNFAGLSKEYPEYGTYDTEKKKFYGKYHPVIKIKYLGDILFVGFAAISGFSLYYPAVLEFVNNYLGIVGITINLVWFRAIHFLIFIYFLCVLMFHAYLSLIPVNGELLKAMIYGKEDTEVHVDSDKP